MGKSARFAGRTALVTGAGGFIGAAVCRRLADEGAEVVGLEIDRAAAERVRGAGARFVACDVTDPAALRAAWPDAGLVVHTAAHVREHGAMEEFVELNVRGTVNVLDAAAEGGAERVVHVSSVVVYGYDDPSEQGEDALHRTYGIPYIDTKSASDRIALARGAIAIRPGDVYGPGSLWVKRPLELARAGLLSVPHPGTGLMLPVYVDDLVEAILLGLERGRPGRAYAVWSGERVTFRDYFDRFARMVGHGRARRLPRPLLVAIAAALERGARVLGRPPSFTVAAIVFVDRRGTVSTERIRGELGWEPRVTLDEGLRRVELWARAEGLL